MTRLLCQFSRDFRSSAPRKLFLESQNRSTTIIYVLHESVSTSSEMNSSAKSNESITAVVHQHSLVPESIESLLLNSIHFELMRVSTSSNEMNHPSFTHVGNDNGYCPLRIPFSQCYNDRRPNAGGVSREELLAVLQRATEIVDGTDAYTRHAVVGRSFPRQRSGGE